MNCHGCTTLQNVSLYDEAYGEFGAPKFIEAIAAGFNRAGQGVSNLFNQGSKSLNQAFKQTQNNFKVLTSKATASFMELVATGKAKFKWLTKKIADGVKKAWEALKKLGSKMLAFLKKFIADIMKGLLAFMKKTAQSLGLIKKSSGLSGPFDKLKGKGQTTFEEITCSFKNHFKNPDTQKELVATAAAAIGAGIVSAGAAAAGVAGAAAARHTGEVVGNALNGGQCPKPASDSGEGSPFSEGGSFSPKNLAIVGGIGLAAVVAFSVFGGSQIKPKTGSNAAKDADKLLAGLDPNLSIGNAPKIEPKIEPIIAPKIDSKIIAKIEKTLPKSVKEVAA